MDRKTLLLLFYCTAILPISYTVAQGLFPNRGWLGFGLLNTIILIIFSLFFSTTPSNNNSKKKNIALIILALFVGTILFSGLIDDILVDSSLWFHRQLSSSRVATFDRDIMTSGAQKNTGTIENLVIVPVYSGTAANTGTTPIILESDDDVLSVNTGTKTNTIKENPTPTTSHASDSSLGVINFAEGTYGKLIPYLVKTYKLADTDKINPVFQFVSAKSSLYSPFATAYANTMIGKDVKPTTKVSCDTYLVLKGIAARRKVSFTGSPFVAYRAEAQKRGVVNGCDTKEYVTNKTL